MKTQLLVSLIVALASASASACRVPMRPEPGQLEGFKAIYLAEVVGVRLTQHISLSDKCEEPPSGLSCIDFDATDSTEQHEVDFLRDQNIRGTAPLNLRVTLGGCQVVVPQLRQMALVFVPKDSKEPIVAVYDSQGIIYAEFLLALGHQQANQPPHPTPTAAEAPASGAGERRR